MQTLNDLKTMLSFLKEGAYIVDASRKILYFNPIAETISGYQAEEVEGSYCHDNILNHVDEHGHKLCVSACPLQDSIDTDVINQNEVYLHHKFGHRVKVQVTTLPYVLQTNQGRYGVELFQESRDDVQEQTIHDLKRLNLTDDLTSLFNRRHLRDILEGKINPFVFKTNGCLFLDIDNFRDFNNTYGHQVGDTVLKVVGNTIKKNIGIKDFAIRYGGEEFVVILNNVSPSSITAVAEKLRMLVAHSNIEHQGKRLHVTVSIGAAMFNEAQELKHAIAAADQAMLIAKQSGKNTVVLDKKLRE